jgi:hypothetical protein
MDVNIIAEPESPARMTECGLVLLIPVVGEKLTSEADRRNSSLVGGHRFKGKTEMTHEMDFLDPGDCELRG